MSRGVLAGVLAAAILAAGCAGEKTPAAAPSATSEPIATPPARIGEPADLVYWDTLFLSGPLGEPPPGLVTLLESLVVERGPGMEAVLIELALYPTPYREHAWDLLGSGDELDFDALLAMFAQTFEPEDDADAYVEFKARLLGTIDPGFAMFLDPTSPRTISAREVIWGGVPVDGIPPLNDPSFVSADRASEWILPSDLVIGVEINGDARAYPRRIIDWHEMVNDTVGGVPVSLAYCTLCGSAILYDGRYEGRTFRFGTSGLLYRSNKLMYDTTTRTLWEQYTGEPVWGELVGHGIRLEILPAVHTTWAEWLAAHPDTRVLDIDTGFRRDYGSGVAYADYWASPDLRFPAPDRQGPLAVKDVVYTVRLGGEAVAYPVDLLAQRGWIEDEIDGRAVIVVPTPDGNGGRAYERGRFSFVSANLSSAQLVDEDGGVWRIGEDALVSEEGGRLKRLPGHNSFWFAVVNHAPQWRLYQE